MVTSTTLRKCLKWQLSTLKKTAVFSVLKFNSYILKKIFIQFRLGWYFEFQKMLSLVPIYKIIDMNKKEYDYFRFPLSFLSLALRDGRIYDKIISYCLINFIDSSEVSIQNLVKAVFYHYHRRRNEMPDEIAERITEFYRRHNELAFEDDGFLPSEIDSPLFNIEGEFTPPLYDEFMSEVEEDFDLKTMLWDNSRYFKLPFARKHFDCKGASINDLVEDYDELIEHQKRFKSIYGKEPFVNVKTNLLWDVKDKRITVAEFHLLAAIKSVIGKKRFDKTYREILVMRACGATKKEVLSSIYTGGVKDFYDYYIKRYPFDKVIDSLSRKKMVSRIADYKGFFVSTALSHEQLYSAILKKQAEYNKPKEEELKYGKMLKLKKKNNEIANKNAASEQHQNNT